MDEKLQNPWARLYRGDLKSGFAYPVNASEIASALRAAGAEVGALSFIVSGADGRLTPKKPSGLLLLFADWEERRDMPFQGCGGELAIYAAPTARRPEIRALLLREALPAAAHWLADAARRGQVWREMRHERWFTLRDSGLSIEDREGGSWSTVRRA